MTCFTFHILKLNTIAALIICAACIVSRLTRKKYTCKWKYFVWLVTALALLVPVDLSPFSRVQLQIVQPTRRRGCGNILRCAVSLQFQLPQHFF